MKHKKLKVSLIIIAAVLIAIILPTLFTPYPTALVLNLAFKKGVKTEPDNFHEIQQLVNVHRDLKYESTAKKNMLDLFLPKTQNELTPIVIWIHGGGFVGGDKSDVDYFATCLAADGFAVASINYQLAPWAKFPSPINQTGEAYKWLKDNSEKYSIDVSRIMLAGDSAGAHTAAAFVSTQLSKEYADNLGVYQVVENPSTIKGTLLYCGPYSLAEIKKLENGFMRFVFSKAAAAYFGTSNWLKKYDNKASTIFNIPNNFPPCFITDGNTGSFEKQAKMLISVFDEKGIIYDSYFTPKETAQTQHEYQFILDTPEAQMAYNKTVQFLSTYM